MPLAALNRTGRHRAAQRRHPSRTARAWPLGLAVRAAGAVARQQRRPHTAAAMGTQQVPGPEGCSGAGQPRGRAISPAPSGSGRRGLGAWVRPPPWWEAVGQLGGRVAAGWLRRRAWDPGCLPKGLLGWRRLVFPLDSKLELSFRNEVYYPWCLMKCLTSVSEDLVGQLCLQRKAAGHWPSSCRLVVTDPLREN